MNRFLLFLICTSIVGSLSAGEIKFTENKGQIHDQNFEARPDVLFSGEAKGMVFHLRKDGVSYQLYKKISKQRPGESADSISIHRIGINWINSKTDFTVEYGETIEGYNNYYLASCPEGALNVRSYKSVTFKNVWDGIDIKWYQKNGELEYDFIVSPGAGIDQINWEVTGVTKLTQEKGVLIMEGPFGQINEHPPVAYQSNKEIRVKRTLNSNVIGFKSNRFDRSKPLVIDPLVVTRNWAFYYGGSLHEQGNEIKFDGNSNFYFSGFTTSISLIATSGIHQTSHGGLVDAIMVKFNSSGSRIWSTYYGGSLDDAGLSCAIEDTTAVYLVGSTKSLNGISSVGSHQSMHSSGPSNEDAFVVKFNASGIRVWGTYYGGSGLDEAVNCAIDSSSNVYVVGTTSSVDSIASMNGYKSTFGSSSLNAFLVKFNPSGARLWATYYGGNSFNKGRSCAIDKNSNIYMAGSTVSSTGIATTGSHQTTKGGMEDAFLVKFNSNGIRQWGTYYGGTGTDVANSCETDEFDDVYIAGRTKSTSKIITNPIHQALNAGNGDAFLAKFNSNGVRQWGTYYGGTSPDDGVGISIDAAKNVYLSGTTFSSNSIATSGSHQTIRGGDVDGFLVKFDSIGQRKWGTYYGGTDVDIVLNNSLYGSNSIYLIGFTWSDTTMATNGSYQSVRAGNNDIFVTKFIECDPDSISISITACDSFVSFSGNHIWKSSGTYLDILSNNKACDSIISVDLTIVSINSMIALNGSVLLADSGYTGYQWLDCENNYSPINGETRPFYAPLKNGRYAVKINEGQCADTSACIDLTWIGTGGILGTAVKVYPNPTEDFLIIAFGQKETAKINLTNDLGQSVFRVEEKNVQQSTLDLSFLNNGVYFLSIETADFIHQEKIMVR
ncbi:MAG: T9SS type A sorting domain-containing protein [Vicingaceae bacterium]